MTDKPVRIDVNMSAGQDEVLFTLVYADGYRSSYWKPFWPALWHIIRLNMSGLNVVEAKP